jgi:hypothetical protein
LKYLYIENSAISSEQIYIIFDEVNNETGTTVAVANSLLLSNGGSFGQSLVEYDHVIPINGISIQNISVSEVAVVTIIEA